MLLTTLKLVSVATALFLGKGGELPPPPPVMFVDSDNDGVDDADDLCPGSDDTVDLNANDIPDCDETAGPNLMFDTASSIANATVQGNSVGSYSWTDGAGWSGSGSLQVASNLGNVTPGMSVCLNVPVFYETFELWFQARTAWTASALVYAEVREYDGKGCTGQTGIGGNYATIGTAGVSSSPWPIFSHDVALKDSTRSVRMVLTMGTSEPWIIDNILLLPVLESEGEGDPPPMD